MPLIKNQLKSGERIVRVATREGEGQEAMTRFKVLERFDLQYLQATLLEAILVTGRTHQIRVHASESGHPIIGDDKYYLKYRSIENGQENRSNKNLNNQGYNKDYNKDFNQKMKNIPGFRSLKSKVSKIGSSRLFLHARQISLILPGTHSVLKIEAPLDSVFTNTLNLLSENRFCQEKKL